MSENLESAHVQGRDRTDIIDALLGTSYPDGVVSVDLVEFESAFKAEHQPFEKAMLILCTDCHRAYDADQVKRGRPASTGRTGASAVSTSGSAGDFFPITLEPASPDAFKSELLASKKAKLEISYSDGTVESRPWSASRFSES